MLKIFKGKYEAKLKFPEGWRGQSKIPSVGEVWTFSGTTQLKEQGSSPGDVETMFWTLYHRKTSSIQPFLN